MVEIDRIINNQIYLDDLKTATSFNLPWNQLNNKTILLIGATGMIGSCLIDCLMYRNQNYNSNISIVAVSRNENRAKERFARYWKSNNFKYISLDCKNPLPDKLGKIDFAIHAASNTHPVAYSTDPVGTITSNVFGTYNLLEYLKKQKCRVLLVSSVEIYGENNSEIDSFSEKDCGYIDCNTMRAGYPESKRVSESLCQAYISKYKMNIVIARLCRIFGPTMLESDSKALSQFIKKAVKGEDIVLKSEGNQFYSYAYVFDAVTALLIILLKSKNGEAYNVSDIKFNITLKELSKIIANSVGKKVIFELPDIKEEKGYSTATKAILDSTKLNRLGWYALFSLKEDLVKTIKVLKS